MTTKHRYRSMKHTTEPPTERVPAGPELERATSPEPAATEYLQIGELAEQTGLTQRTLRYYEEIGLLDPPSRMAGGFRLYSPQDVARIEQIVRLKQLLGFSLAEIKTIIAAQEELSELRSQYRADPDTQHRLAALDRAESNVRRQLDLIDHKIEQMQTMRAELTAKLVRYDLRRAELQAVLGAAQGPTDR
jgi:MerR family transcriptional regulator, repressor of the yfmOP operon